MMWISIDFRKASMRVDAWWWRYYGSSWRATRGGIGRLGCGPVAVRRRGLACPVVVSCLDACGYCSLRRSLPAHGLGIGIARRAGARARCPRNDHRSAETDAARSPLAPGSRRLYFTKVNKSHRRPQFFGQQQKTNQNSPSYEPARVRGNGNTRRNQTKISVLV